MKMDEQYSKYFHFLRFALGIENEAPTDMDWQGLYAFARSQTLLGVVFDGIARLPKELVPASGLLTIWIGCSMKIMQRNQLMYKLSAEVYSEIRKMGFRCCVLKGQGNAMAYPNRYSRTSGDVDVWVMTNSRDELRQIAKGLADSPSDIEREIVNHIELNRRGVTVELHPTPMIFNNPILNHRMQKWFTRNADLQWSNIVNLPDGVGQIAIPTATFNAIYQLSHLYHHFFYEGVGLRQIIDYYYVLMGLQQMAQTDTNPLLNRESDGCLEKNSKNSREANSLFAKGSDDGSVSAVCEQAHTANTDSSSMPLHGICMPLGQKQAASQQKQSLADGNTKHKTQNVTQSTQNTLRHLGLYGFAGATMYVLHEVLGLSEDKMIVTMDVKRGKLLLDEILSGGNFGQYGNHSFESGTLGHNLQRLKRDVKLVRYYPLEALAEPFFRVWHFFWRVFHKAN